MNNKQIIKELNKIQYTTSKLIEKLENLDKQNETLEEMLNEFGYPTDKEFIAILSKIITEKDLTIDQIKTTFSNVEKANKKDPKKNIKSYIIGSLKKI